MGKEQQKHDQGSETPKPKPRHPEDVNDEAYDKTIEDSFPASDPPSSIPDPEDEENAA